MNDAPMTWGGWDVHIHNSISWVGISLSSRTPWQVVLIVSHKQSRGLTKSKETAGHGTLSGTQPINDVTVKDAVMWVHNKHYDMVDFFHRVISFLVIENSVCMYYRQQWPTYYGSKAGWQGIDWHNNEASFSLCVIHCHIGKVLFHSFIVAITYDQRSL